MIRSEIDIIYNNLKNRVGFHRSKKFIKWFHENYPGMQMHHLFGSYSQKLKTSDYCSVPVTAVQHAEAEKNKSEFAVRNLDKMIEVMQKYLIHLENSK
jgi:hypothetical protein